MDEIVSRVEASDSYSTRKLGTIVLQILPDRKVVSTLVVISNLSKRRNFLKNAIFIAAYSKH